MDDDTLFLITFYAVPIVLICILDFIEKCKEVKNLKEDKSKFNYFMESRLNELKKQENDAFDREIAVSQKEKLLSQKEKLLSLEFSKLEKERIGLKNIALERQKGCPWLEDEYDRLFALRDHRIESYFFHEAPKSTERVKEANKKRRLAEKNERIYKNIIDYYESIAPFLIELKEEVVSDDNIKELQKYTEEERLDKVVEYLTIEEYHNLSIIERNQLALDRYWKRPKSNSHIGRIYERYVGYQYESKGFNVSFEGIFKGLEDLGRDLICTKGKTAHIVQCKYWSKFKTIHEKHIFQLFGSMYQYRKQILKENQYTKVIGLFCTTTKVSELAHEFAKDIGIDIRDNFEMNYDYPCIKCNINENTKEKIYHLPFDQMYDKVKIETKKGEFYCKTVKEAEENGFRRAKKYFSISNKKTP